MTTQNPDATLTVGQLVEALMGQNFDKPVQVWMPGTYINLSAVFSNEGRVLIEGNRADD